MTAGNPYGALGSCLAVVGLVVEFAWSKRWAPVRRALLGGIAVGLVAPLTYLPLVLTQSVTYRNDSKIGNSGLMVPGLGDLLNASTPSFAAWVDAFEHPFLTVPATYLAWYALPLLPWLRYRAIVDALVSRMAVPVYAVLGLAFSVGPSEAWMFRWPLRVVPYFVLPTAILLAIALTQGLAGDFRRRRAVGSLLLILGGAYLAEATRPDLVKAHAASALLVGTLTRSPWPSGCGGPRAARAPAVLVAGCVAVLRSRSRCSRAHEPQRLPVPHNVATTSAALVPRYPGTTLQVANNGCRGALRGPGRADVRGHVRQHAPGCRRAGRDVLLRHGFQGVHRRPVHRVQRLGLPGRPPPRRGRPPRPARRHWPTCCGWRRS